MPVRSARKPCSKPASATISANKRRLEAALADYASAIRDYASDFELEIADMFDTEQEIEYADPEDPDVGYEIHWMLGWLECAAHILCKDPVSLVIEHAEAEHAGGGH